MMQNKKQHIIANSLQNGVNFVKHICFVQHLDVQMQVLPENRLILFKVQFKLFYISFL